MASTSHNELKEITVAEGFQNTLRWRHNDHDGVSNHQPHGCLLNRLFRRRSKKTSKLRVTGLCVGNSPGPVNSPHKGPVTRKMFPFDDVIMTIWSASYDYCRRFVLCFVGLWFDLYQCTRDTIIALLLRQIDVATSFWRNNDVIITSCARRDAHLSGLLHQRWATRSIVIVKISKYVVKDELAINKRIKRYKDKLYFRDWMVNYPIESKYSVISYHGR